MNSSISYKDLFRYFVRRLSFAAFMKETMVMSFVAVNLMVFAGIMDGQFQSIAQIRVILNNPLFIGGAILVGVFYGFFGAMLSQVAEGEYGLIIWRSTHDN